MLIKNWDLRSVQKRRTVHLPHVDPEAQNSVLLHLAQPQQHLQNLQQQPQQPLQPCNNSLNNISSTYNNNLNNISSTYNNNISNISSTYKNNLNNISSTFNNKINNSTSRPCSAQPHTKSPTTKIISNNCDCNPTQPSIPMEESQKNSRRPEELS